MTESNDDPFATGAALGVFSELTAGDRDSLIGRELDGYRITEFIAEGGMSRVYRASRIDGSFERDVAIKLSAVSGFSQGMRDRFMREQAVLAGLNHPNISQLFDARVTAEGWPYIVMELVEGSPITRLCEDQSLPLHGRITLLMDVVDAVAFAHGNLVVHRDIKPSNVLVTTDRRVKLLDFGIAKLLRDEPGEQTKGGAMTPRYASPEQLLGKPITIASDIYQLGLLMAEVFARQLPTKGETLTDAIQRAAEARPLTLPDKIRKSLPRELTLIIEQCLRAEASDRYSDANALRRDLEAFLSGYPVSAAGQQPGYRFRKFVQRNRGGVIAASLALLALLAATVITAVQMVEAKRQRDSAMYQQQRVQASVEFYSLLMEEMGDGAFTSVELLDRGQRLLNDQFGTGQPFMASVLYDVARRYSSMGEPQREAELLSEAERIAREYEDDNVLAAVLCKLARSNQRADPQRSSEQLAEGLGIYEALPSPGIDTSVECLRARSGAELRAGDANAALATLFTAKELLDAHPSPGTNLQGLILNQIAFRYFNEGRPNEAIGFLDEVLALLESTGRGNTLGYQRVAANRAIVLSRLGRTPDALAAFADLLERMRASGFKGRGTAPLLAQYGNVLLTVKRFDEAEAIYTESLALAQADGNDSATAQVNLGLARVHLAGKDFERAGRHLEQAEAFIADAERTDRTLAGHIRVVRAKLHRATGDPERAAQEITALLSQLGYPESRNEPALVSALIEGTEVFRQLGDHDRAGQLAEALVEILEQKMRPDAEGNINFGRALLARAEIRLETGNPADAATDLASALPHLVYALGEDHPECQTARALLSRARDAATG